MVTIALSFDPEIMDYRKCGQGLDLVFRCFENESPSVPV